MLKAKEKITLNGIEYTAQFRVWNTNDVPQWVMTRADEPKSIFIVDEYFYGEIDGEDFCQYELETAYDYSNQPLGLNYFLKRMHYTPITWWRRAFEEISQFFLYLSRI